MAKGKRKIPNVVVMPDGSRYSLVVAKIHTRDDKDRPEDLTLIPDDGTMELSGGEEFMTVYVLESTMVNKR